MVRRVAALPLALLLSCSESAIKGSRTVDTGEGLTEMDCTYEWGCWAFDQEVVASGSPNSTLTFKEDSDEAPVVAELVLRTANICAGGGASAAIDPGRLCGANIGATNTFLAEHKGSELPDLSALPTEWEIDLVLLECLGYQRGSDLFQYRRIPTTASIRITAVDGFRVHFDLHSVEGIDRAAGEDDSTLTITTDVQICDRAGVTPFRLP